MLTAAVEDGVVGLAEGWPDPHPQARSSGELTAVVAVLNRYFASDAQRRADTDGAVSALNERWEKAVGNSLENVEELAACEPPPSGFWKRPTEPLERPFEPA